MQDKARYVNEVFNSIAQSYDRMNLLMTWGMLPIWQKKVIRLSKLKLGDRGLDVCCGTGEMACQIAKLTGVYGEAIGLDFSEEMLETARYKQHQRGIENICFVQGNALEMPFPNNGFDAAVCGFALRNVTDIPQVISEMARVVRPGGRVVCIDVSRPVTPLARLFFNLYYYKIVPKLGDLLVSDRIVGGNYTPYTWLAESLRHFPNRRVIKQFHKDVGLIDVQYKIVGFGAATIYYGTKPTAAEALIKEAEPFSGKSLWDQKKIN